jgi:hypothetical protein
MLTASTVPNPSFRKPVKPGFVLCPFLRSRISAKQLYLSLCYQALGQTCRHRNGMVSGNTNHRTPTKDIWVLRQTQIFAPSSTTDVEEFSSNRDSKTLSSVPHTAPVLSDRQRRGMVEPHLRR